ncbi:NAD(P)/FAD-dependent oxidoreductase [Kitasatospora sp. NPDC001175]|uniref:NAD(P)/FAD-dependent oxidoreductase n=1 Tax=Kitasatospora sp. NPDC001175 TaxID=3157103 RepID=UPI003D08A47C
MGMESAYVIVGASLAGAKAAETLREEGFEGPVVLIGDEQERPYERPPLSKGYLMGKTAREKIHVHSPEWYKEHSIDLRLGTTVTAVDLAAHRVTLADGSSIGFGRLLLTTGASPRRLQVPGADRENVCYLRRVEDSDRIQAFLRPGARVAVIGAGWIGMETASAAREAGCEVTVLGRSELPLLGTLGREAARVFADLHRDHGVELRFGVQVTEITEHGVRLGDGTLVEADAVIVGIGVTPNTRLAAAAGLRVDNGVLTDQHLQSSHPDVFAAGDVVNAFHPLYDRPIRVEHWANALHQPRTAARSMLGEEAVHDRVPYFFTDQYELGMEYTGYIEPGGYDRVVFRGDVPGREFIAFWLSRDRVLAGMNVNIWDVTDAIRDLVRSGRPVDPDALADPDTPLDRTGRPQQG